MAAAVGYAIFIYRNSLPRLPRGQRLFLNVLRILALVSILFISAEPIVRLGKTLTVQPKHLVFIDNSLSITKGSKQVEKSAVIQSWLTKLNESSKKENVSLYTFGKEVKSFKPENGNKPDYSEPVTDFSQIFESIRKNNLAPSSITIISDGIITEGQNPLSSAERLSVPIAAIGLGDSTTKKDLAVPELLTNEFLYPGVITPVRVSVQNSHFGSASTRVSLYEESKLLETKSVVLAEGMNTVLFEYKPSSAGEKRLKATVDPIEGEVNKENNAKNVFINVLPNKRKALLVAGYPSADVTFIKQALALDTNIAVSSIIEINRNQTLSPVNQKTIDSADVLIFVHYPVAGSTPQMFSALKKQITEKHKSVFTLIDENSSTPMVKEIEEYLPVRTGRQIPGSSLAQPILFDRNAGHPVFTNSNLGSPSDWENFAPVVRQNNEFLVKPEANQLLSAKLNNVVTSIPLLAARNIGSQRSIAFIGKDIWRWKLSSNTSQSTKFDQFVLTTFKWLFASAQKDNFNIRTNKKFFAVNENVDLFAELYDENLSPVSDAQISVEVQNGPDKSTLLMDQLGNGLYEGHFIPSQKGDYTFTGTANAKNMSNLQCHGRFNTGENQAELAELRSDYQFLAGMSRVSDGAFFPQDSVDGYFSWLHQQDAKLTQYKPQISEIVLWNNPWSLILIILLLSLEWFFRKRAGML